jgi:hypothetical protein
MNRINVNINALRSIAETRSVAWGTRVWNRQGMTWGKNTGALVFAAVLIVCSVTVGCSSDKPKPVSYNNPITEPQMQSPAVPAPAMQAESKPAPAPKKVVHKKPATVNYADKTYGVTFEYPRRYAIETGNAATEMLASKPIAMNFVQPGGVALAAVELPETGFANTDFSSAFFDVSVHKSLSADQCSEFAVPQPKSSQTASAPVEPMPAQATPMVAASDTNKRDQGKSDTTKPTAATDAAPAPVATAQVETPKPEVTATPSVQTQSEPQGSKLLIGDIELRATEAVSGEGTRQSDSKYFHVFQNGACYEFALNVTTVASEEGVTKHVDRDKVFGRLEQILATVKINPVAAPEVKTETTAEVPATPATETPAQ